MRRVACSATRVVAVMHLHFEVVDQVPHSGPAQVQSHCLVSLPVAVASLCIEFQLS